MTACAVAGFGLGVAGVGVTSTQPDAKPPLSAYWWQQTYGDCVEMASRVVIADRTGVVLSEAQMEATAAQVADYTRQGGTTWAKVPALLAAYNVDAYLAQDMTMAGLRHELATGADVIVAVESDVLWAAEGLTGQHGSPDDHAVAVESVTDDSVVVVDSAWAGGKGAVVSAASFWQAWHAGGTTLAVVAPTNK